MRNFVRIEADFVRSQIEKIFIDYPDLRDDLDFAAEVFENETDLYRVLEKLLNERREAETMASALKDREGDIVERRKRYERKADSVKKIMLQLMEAAQQDKVTLTEATLSITKPRESVEVTDLDAIPQGFFKTERKALSKEILAALKAGEKIPGAEIRIGEAGLMVRTK